MSWEFSRLSVFGIPGSCGDAAAAAAVAAALLFQRRRETEIKHGRINMLATMGYITPELVGKFPGYLSPYYGLKFEDAPNCLAAISKVPNFGCLQIGIWCKSAGLNFDHFTEGYLDRDAGDLGWKPHLLTSSDLELRKKQLSTELTNGRLAMIAIIGMFFHDGLMGSAWGDWGDWADYMGSPLRAFESELGAQALVGVWDPLGLAADGHLGKSSTIWRSCSSASNRGDVSDPAISCEGLLREVVLRVDPDGGGAGLVMSTCEGGYFVNELSNNSNQDSLSAGDVIVAIEGQMLLGLDEVEVEDRFRAAFHNGAHLLVGTLACLQECPLDELRESIFEHWRQQYRLAQAALLGSFKGRAAVAPAAADRQSSGLPLKLPPGPPPGPPPPDQPVIPPSVRADFADTAAAAAAAARSPKDDCLLEAPQKRKDVSIAAAPEGSMPAGPPVTRVAKRHFGSMCQRGYFFMALMAQVDCRWLSIKAGATRWAAFIPLKDRLCVIRDLLKMVS